MVVKFSSLRHANSHLLQRYGETIEVIPSTKDFPSSYPKPSIALAFSIYPRNPSRLNFEGATKGGLSLNPTKINLLGRKYHISIFNTKILGRSKRDNSLP